MPRYAVKFGHYLILESTVFITAPDRTKAQEIAENIKARGSLGEIVWSIKDSTVSGWEVKEHFVEIETVQEE